MPATASVYSVPYLFSPSDFQYNQALNTDLTSIGGQVGVNVLTFSADPTGATDSTIAIQNAINAVPATGGTVFLPAGNYKISSALKIGNGTSSSVSTINGIVLVGQGLPVTSSVPFSKSTTTISWVGASNSVMIAVLGPLVGWGVQNLCLEAGSTPGVSCISLVSAQQGDCRNLVLSRCFQGIQSLSYDLAGGLAGAGNLDSIGNNYTNLNIILHDQSGGPKAFLFTGSGNSTPNSDTDYAYVANARVSFDGTSNPMYGAYLQVCDSCVFHNLHVDGGNANMKSANFDYTVNSNFPNSCKFFGFDPGGANLCAVSGAATVGNNQIYALMTGNGGNVQTLSGVTYV